jgi:PAS domain S-box-containing protein
LIESEQDPGEKLPDGPGEMLDYSPREVGRRQEDFERVRAQLALRSSEARFRLLVDSVRDYAIFMVGPNGHVSTWNRGAERILGYRPHEIIGHSIGLFHTEGDREIQLSSEHLRLAEMFGRFEEEGWRVRKDGEQFWAHGTVSALWDDTGLIGFAIVMRDLSERRAAEESLRQNEMRFRSLIENASDTIEIIEPDLTIVYASPAVERVIAFTPREMAGRSLAEFLHPEDLLQLRSILERVIQSPDSPATLELRKKHRSGGWRSMSAIVSNMLDDPGVRGLVITCRDMTDQNVMAAQLRQAQKMDAVGQLAGGVAHDFNNLLTVIKGNIELLRMDVAETSAVPAEIDEIRKAADRAAGLTRQLLAFSRKQLLHARAVDLNELVEEIEPMLRRLIGEDIQVVSGLDKAIPSVLADPGQVHQVLVNLAVNARDAMPRGGVLLIETSTVDVGERYARAHAGVAIPHGKYVQLKVTDNGSGMTSEVRARIFEPFFTTKTEGRGTGLGLATVYGIVKQSGGFIWVESDVGKGSSFQILLPAADSTAAVEHPVSERDDQFPGSETILLVEDEEPLRLLTKRVLERHGYRVLSARNGREAVEIASTFDGPIHLVLTDVVMPGMSGREIGERLSAVRPEARLLYMSGYTDDEIIRRGLLDPNLALLEKPFSPIDLARTVRRVLDGTPTSTH